MKKLFMSITFLIGMCLIQACQQPNEVNVDKSASASRQGAQQDGHYVDLSVRGDYEVRDGMFYFKDAESFFVLEKALTEENSNKQIEQVKGLGFTSLLEIQTNVYDLLSKGENLDQYNELLLSNKDIFHLEGDYIKPSFSSLSLALLNREGMVSIGGKVHCFAYDKIIIAPNVEKAREAIKTGVNSEGTVTFPRHATDVKGAGGRVAATSCSKFSRSAQSPDGQREALCEVYGERRVIFEGYYSNYGNLYTLDYYARVNGTTVKRNCCGRWVNYDTSNDLYSRFTAYFGVNEFASYPVPPLSPVYTSSYLVVNEPHVSNFSSSIIFDKVVARYNSIPEAQLQQGFWGFVASFEESSQVGTYSSGGVPNGVTMQCP